MISKNNPKPYLVYSDERGNIFEDTDYYALGRFGNSFKPLFEENLIELPKGSDLFVLQGRHPLGIKRKTGVITLLDDVFAVSAFLSPAHTQLLLSAYKREGSAPVLPLFAYTAVGWYEGRFYVPALRIDPDKRQEPYLFDQKRIIKSGREILKKFPKNRLISHIVKNCAFTYLCPAARNFCLGRYEAPLPTSPSCNSRCLGCISFQKKGESPISCTQPRITFTPSPEEIAETALFHIERAKNPVVSFGQGCEGEPLLVADVLVEAVRLIRKKTDKGIINLNTNGSLPERVERLFEAGLDSIRVSVNSFRKDIYNRYYEPVNYTFEDVIETLRIGERYRKWVSINYFVFPGLTDDREEYEALREVLKNVKVNMIQWRNFNIDPDWYLETIKAKTNTNCLGIKNVINLIKKEFPHLYYGYFNPGEEIIAKYLF
ncbi:MAG: radical SAM protein [Proteobacteria bacterium]|nr:radical SAM protein [Pseudomonadota bacterium]